MSAGVPAQAPAVPETPLPNECLEEGNAEGGRAPVLLLLGNHLKLLQLDVSDAIYVSACSS